MMTPELGQIVWYHPEFHISDDKRHAAIIVRVINDDTVDLTVFDSNGLPYPMRDVTLIRDPKIRIHQRQAEWTDADKKQFEDVRRQLSEHVQLSDQLAQLQQQVDDLAALVAAIETPID